MNRKEQHIGIERCGYRNAEMNEITGITTGGQSVCHGNPGVTQERINARTTRRKELNA